MNNTSFQKIGYETTIDKKRWAGPVIAMADHIYCVLGIANSRSDILMRGVGGGLGGIIGGVIAGAIIRNGSQSTPAMGTVCNVPQFLCAPKTGPLRRFKPATPVLIIPRDAIYEIDKKNLINNTLHIQLGIQKIMITHSLFSPSKVREFLTASGWPLIWRGQRYNGAGDCSL